MIETMHTVKIINLHPSTTYVQLRSVFTSCGKIRYISIINFPNDETLTMLGFICFYRLEAAYQAISRFGNITLNSRKIRMELLSTSPMETYVYFRSHERKFLHSNLQERYMTLRVDNLSTCISEIDLWAVFNEVASVCCVHIPLDEKTKTSLGFGYVQFTSYGDANLARQMVNNEIFRDRLLIVTPVYAVIDHMFVNSGDGRYNASHRNPANLITIV